jgi:hypothetical protein
MHLQTTMNNNTVAIAVFAIFVALGIATVVPGLQISYAARPPGPDCHSVNEHHQPQICALR